MSWFSKLMTPERGFTRPEMARRVVDFPAPFAVDAGNFRLLPYAISCAVGVYLP